MSTLKKDIINETKIDEKPDLDVQKFLEGLKRAHYMKLFASKGFTTMEDMMLLNLQRLKEDFSKDLKLSDCYAIADAVESLRKIKSSLIPSTAPTSIRIDPFPTSATFQRIFADLAILGYGDVILNACVILKGPTIFYVGPASDIPSLSSTETSDDYHVPVVLPGLWDCHIHFEGITPMTKGDATEYTVIEDEALLVGRSVRHAYEALMAGFTSLREVGGCGWAVKTLIDEGSILGPHVYHSGRALTMTCGHGDCHSLPYEWMCRRINAHVCDGVTECLRGVRLQLRKGATCIKVHATGGVLSKLDHPLHPQFCDEELYAICTEAARSKRIVAAHCHGKEGILSAIRNGARTIEHGSYLDKECATLMKEKNIILVPTRFIVEFYFGKLITTGEAPANMSDEACIKARNMYSMSLDAFRLAIKEGVTVACGTDMSFPQWGRNGVELKYYVEAGMTPLEAIKTATSTGPKTLGPFYAPKSGELREGYDADVIVLSKNPLENIEVIGDPNNVMLVWKLGRLVKNILKQEK